MGLLHHVHVAPSTITAVQQFNFTHPTLLLVFFRVLLGDFMQNSLWSSVQSMRGSAGSLLSRWLGGTAGSVALKLGILLHGKGEEARDAALEPFGLWFRDGFREGFLDGLQEGLGDRDLECLDVVLDRPCLSPTFF